MADDAHDNPYRAQHRRFVLACAECGSVERVAALRLPEGSTENTPYDPLCADCAGIWQRVWGKGSISPMSPPEQDSMLDEYVPVGQSGQSVAEPVRLYVTLCPRCNGRGTVESFGLCFACIGMRYVWQDDRGVRRTARWWQTYQQNRTGEKR